MNYKLFQTILIVNFVYYIRIKITLCVALVTHAVWPVNFTLTVTVYACTSPIRFEAMKVTVVPELRLISPVVALVPA